jgi:hypothetical protein
MPLDTFRGRVDELVRMIDASRIPDMRFLAGLATAPASDDSGRMSIWTVDRAVDNGADPNENDGKLFEISIGSSGGGPNQPPVISDVGISPSAPRTNDTLNATVSATDPNGDPLTYSYQWLKNGTALSGETKSTLDLAKSGNGDRGDALTVRVTASDGQAQDTRTSGPVTVVNSPPRFNHTLPNRSDPEGADVSFSAGATDDYGYFAVENKMHVHDLHATLLHLLGLDHEKLTYRYAGRDFRLTDVSGRVAHDIFA